MNEWSLLLKKKKKMAGGVALRAHSAAAAPWLFQSINTDIKTLVYQGQHLKALKLYIKEPNFPRNATRFTFPPLLKASACLPNIFYGEILHATIITLGLQFDPYITTSLINMYVKCCSLKNAVQLFDTVLRSDFLVGDVTVWNSLIDGYFKNGFIDEGLSRFHQMQILGTEPDNFSLNIVLGICNNYLGYMKGKQVHGYIVRKMFLSDPFVATALIDMYSKFGKPIKAWCLFQKLENNKTIATCNAMISGFCVNGMCEHSFALYQHLKYENFPLDSASFSCLLTTCSQGKNIEFGNQLHCDIIKMGFEIDPYVCTSLITMYAKCSFIEAAEKVFHFSSDKKTEMWNAIISANIDNGCAYNAVNFYHRMRLSAILSDSFTISNLLSGCYMNDLFDFGLMLHGELMKRPIQHNIIVQSSLVTMYSIYGNIKEAILVFNKMKDKDVVVWGSLVSAFCQNMEFEEGMDFFRVMRSDSVKPDPYILENIIGACKGLNNLKLGTEIHGHVIKIGFGSDSFVASSLIDMYSVCGLPEMVEKIFSDLSRKNLVVWNSMISFYSLSGLPNKSINLFSEVIEIGLYPDFVTIIGVLGAISSVAALLKGKAVHGYQIRHEISNLQVDNALINMYIKCGSLIYSERLFQNLPLRNLITWNLMVSGYGSHGKSLQAIIIFDEMIKIGIKPDDLTFISLLSACNHSGLVNEGLGLFHSMEIEHQLEPKMEHYISVVDLLGRSGCLLDAYNFIQTMPIKPDRNIWLSLLSACRAHRNIELGELAASELLKMEPSRGSNYIQILNIYLENGLRDKAANLRAKMKQEGLKKSPGCSWIEVREKTSTFFSGDTSSPSTVAIYKTLKNLKSVMEKKEKFHEVIEVC